MQVNADQKLGPAGHRKRLRARFAKSGRSALADYELLELLLTYGNPSIAGPEDIFAFIRLHLGMRPNEYVYALYLDNANHIIHHCEVAAGTVDKSSLYPREVLKPALIHNATGVVLVHNHPAGQPIPSEEDLAITRELEKVTAPSPKNW
jgi:DNA repair protein RadC